LRNLPARERIILTVRDALAAAIGEKIGRAFEFYVSLDMAVDDPDKFERAIRLLIKSPDSETVKAVVIERLAKQFQIREMPHMSLKDCIQQIKNQET